MGNISEERKYNAIASYIDSFVSETISNKFYKLKLSNPADIQILDLLIAAQSKALQISISFEDRVKENM